MVNMTHVSHKTIFTTGAYHEGLFGLLSSHLCLSLNTLRGSYHSQLANTIPPLPSHTAAVTLSIIATTAADLFLTSDAVPMLRSSCKFCLVPQLPCSCCTFATCARADLINDHCRCYAPAKRHPASGVPPTALPTMS